MFVLIIETAVEEMNLSHPIVRILTTYTFFPLWVNRCVYLLLNNRLLAMLFCFDFQFENFVCVFVSSTTLLRKVSFYFQKSFVLFFIEGSSIYVVLNVNVWKCESELFCLVAVDKTNVNEASFYVLKYNPFLEFLEPSFLSQILRL